MTIWLPDLAGLRGPRYLAIADALERDIADSRIKTGDRLPPQRDLAWALGVTVGTIGRAYAEAGRRGLVNGQVGRGTYVADLRPGQAPRAEAVPGLEASHRYPGAMNPERMDPTLNWFAAHGDSVEAIDLAPNYPSSDGMAAMMGQALTMVGDRGRLEALVNYAHAGGRPEHRAAAARWLKARGVDAQSDQLLVTPGCQGGLTSVFSALTRPGDTVLCEALSWPGMVSYAWMRGLRAQGVAMDQDGVIPEAFEEACIRYRPTAAYLMPTMHNPTTAVLSESRRERLGAIARRHDVFLVEDDVYGFLAPDSPPPIRAFAPDRTVYVSSLSKAVAPGLRVGFVLGPESVMPGINAALRTTILMSAPLQNELAMHLIDSGLAEEAAERQRATAMRRQRLADAVLGHLYRPANSGHGRAFHIWLPLPEPWRMHEFVSAIRSRGVALTPGDAFHVNPPGRGDASGSSVPMNAVRLCLNGPANDDDVRHGLSILADMLRQNSRAALPVI
ncbi:MAG: PLP-dependent aminotransferase family protein [Alphaproteobacteria bacterium]